MRIPALDIKCANKRDDIISNNEITVQINISLDLSITGSIVQSILLLPSIYAEKINQRPGYKPCIYFGINSLITK